MIDRVAAGFFPSLSIAFSLLHDKKFWDRLSVLASKASLGMRADEKAKAI